MDDSTTNLLMNLDQARKHLAKVSELYPPDIATVTRASLLHDIGNLKQTLRSKVVELDKIIAIWDHRASYNQRTDRQVILNALGEPTEEPERDTPKLNALMRGDDAVTFMETSHQDFGSDLEQAFMLGDDTLLKAWVKSLSPVQLGIMQAMTPRLARFVINEALARAHVGDPSNPYRKLLESAPWKNRSLPTELLNDEKPGSFDD